MPEHSGGEVRRARFEELSAQECVELLGTTTVGRVGFASAQGQVILMVNFAFLDGSVFLRTAETGPLAELADGVHDVAFEVDHHDTLSRSGWSVLLNGSTTVVDADQVQLQLSDAGLSQPQPWAAGDRDVLVQLSPRTMSGRRASRRG
jgi:nitroimidazol reductase NimA-like FMN-containing flavoprotein (pyridoxamine 5'-phosphate oxidase superfamily)